MDNNRDTGNIVTENRRDNQEWTTTETQATLLQKTKETIKNGQQQRHRQHCYRKQKRQSRMDNNRDTGNIVTENRRDNQEWITTETQATLLQKTEETIKNGQQQRHRQHCYRKQKRQSRMDNNRDTGNIVTENRRDNQEWITTETQATLLQKTEETIKNGQQQRHRQHCYRKQKRQSRMDNNRDTGNIVTENRRDNQEWTTTETQATLLQKTEETIKNGQQQRHRQHCYRKQKRQSRMDNNRDTGNIVTENRRDNQEWTTTETQATLLQKTEETIKNG